MREALGEHAEAVAAARARWDAERATARLWARDARLFSNTDEARWLGWLELPTADAQVAIGPAALRGAIAEHPAEFVVVLGMGGSSLWPDVLGRTFGGDSTNSRAGRTAARRPLFVLDTTVPDAIEAFLAARPIERGLYFVSSKSGSTIEPNALYALIRERLDARVGRAEAGRAFVAITDPASALEAQARAEGFLGIAYGRPDVGGRFSALSPFGLLPAEAMGLDPGRLLTQASARAAACGPEHRANGNPGVALGTILGTLAVRGHDKLTLSLSPAIASFGSWIEQLVAESTGKQGRGLLPISDEPLGPPAYYGRDRLFVDLALADDASLGERSRRLDALEAAGHPVVRLELETPEALAAAAFEWEFATAVAGSLLGLNPFDQPDVESAKQASRTLLAATKRKSDAAAGVSTAIETSGLVFYPATTLATRSTTRSTTRPSTSPSTPPANPTGVRDLLAALIASLTPGDGFLINAFLHDSPAIRTRLEAIRHAIGAAHPIATALSIGPRYLHSTGQVQKGGPNRLAGLQLWQSARRRGGSPLAIPGIGGNFDGLVEAQAIGDFQVLAERGRRMLGVDLGPDAERGLEILMDGLREALRGGSS